MPLAAERREIALDHLQKCLRRGKLFRKHMRCQPEDPPEDVKIFLIAGDALETNRTIGIDRNGKMHIIAKDHGDGKITCARARYDLNTGGEWMPFARSPIQWSGVCYLPGGHMGIMNSPVFNSNLVNILTSWPSRAQLNTWERLQ